MAEKGHEEQMTDWSELRDTKELEGAKEVVKQAQNFYRSRFHLLGRQLTHELRKILYRDTGAAEKIGSNELLEKLQGMNLSELSSYVDGEMNYLQRSKSTLEQRRSTGGHKFVNTLKGAIEDFGQFLQTFKGIVDIISAADSQFGGVATATLSIFFVTIKLKAEGEAAIFLAMRHIKDRLPDLQTYERIYPDRILGSFLADAYRSVILFAMEASIYFQSRGFWRWLRHIGKPKQYQIRQSEILDNFNRIRVRCESLLASRIDQLAKENQEFRDRENFNYVSSLKDRLGLQSHLDKELDELIQEYALLYSRFEQDRHRQKMNLRTFQATRFYEEWITRGSRLLILCGRNERGIRTDHSWLSPAAIELIADLRRTNKPVACELCTAKSSLDKGLGHIIFQLLSKHRGILQQAETFEFIETRLSQLKSGSEDIAILKDVLVRIVDSFNEPVTIVFNRPERSEESSNEYLETLHSLVMETKTELRALMVVDTAFWKVHEVTFKGRAQQFCQIAKIDQQRI